MPGPKSSVVVNMPLDTATAELVTGTAASEPVWLVGYSEKVKS